MPRSPARHNSTETTVRSVLPKPSSALSSVVSGAEIVGEREPFVALWRQALGSRALGSRALGSRALFRELGQYQQIWLCRFLVLAELQQAFAHDAVVPFPWSFDTIW